MSIPMQLMSQKRKKVSLGDDLRSTGTSRGSIQNLPQTWSDFNLSKLFSLLSDRLQMLHDFKNCAESSVNF